MLASQRVLGKDTFGSQAWADRSVKCFVSGWSVVYQVMLESLGVCDVSCSWWVGGGGWRGEENVTNYFDQA